MDTDNNQNVLQLIMTTGPTEFNSQLDPIIIDFLRRMFGLQAAYNIVIFQQLLLLY